MSPPFIFPWVRWPVSRHQCRPVYSRPACIPWTPIAARRPRSGHLMHIRAGCACCPLPPEGSRSRLLSHGVQNPEGAREQRPQSCRSSGSRPNRAHRQRSCPHRREIAPPMKRIAFLRWTNCWIRQTRSLAIQGSFFSPFLSDKFLTRIRLPMKLVPRVFNVSTIVYSAFRELGRPLAADSCYDSSRARGRYRR